MPKMRKINVHASKLAHHRWSKVPKDQRASHVPRSGGRPRIYPKCRRYKSHRFHIGRRRREGIVCGL